MKSFWKKNFHTPSKKKTCVVEISRNVLVGNYVEGHFDEDLQDFLERRRRRTGSTVNKVLIIDVGPDPWMYEVATGVVVSEPCHVGPFLMLPALNSVFETCADIVDWSRTNAYDGCGVVLIVASSSFPNFNRLAPVALVASSLLMYINRADSALDALETFLSKSREAHLVGADKLGDPTVKLPNLCKYLKLFSKLCLKPHFPVVIPLEIMKIMFQGKLKLSKKQKWNPIIRFYVFAKGQGEGECMVIGQSDYRGDVIYGDEFASFQVNTLAFGDFVLSFEHHYPKENRTKPLFSIAQHTSFMSAPYTRFRASDLEVYPDAKDIVTIDKDFTVDVFLRTMPAVTEAYVTGAAAMAEEYGKETVGMLDLVTSQMLSVEEIVSLRPSDDPLVPKMSPKEIQNTLQAQSEALHKMLDNVPDDMIADVLTTFDQYQDAGQRATGSEQTSGEYRSREYLNAEDEDELDQILQEDFGGDFHIIENDEEAWNSDAELDSAGDSGQALPIVVEDDLDSSSEERISQKKKKKKRKARESVEEDASIDQIEDEQDDHLELTAIDASNLILEVDQVVPPPAMPLPDFDEQRLVAAGGETNLEELMPSFLRVGDDGELVAAEEGESGDGEEQENVPIWMMAQFESVPSPMEPPSAEVYGSAAGAPPPPPPPPPPAPAPKASTAGVSRDAQPVAPPPRPAVAAVEESTAIPGHPPPPPALSSRVKTSTGTDAPAPPPPPPPRATAPSEGTSAPLPPLPPPPLPPRASASSSSTGENAAPPPPPVQSAHGSSDEKTLPPPAERVSGDATSQPAPLPPPPPPPREASASATDPIAVPPPPPPPPPRGTNASATEPVAVPAPPPPPTPREASASATEPVAVPAPPPPPPPRGANASATEPVAVPAPPPPPPPRGANASETEPVEVPPPPPPPLLRKTDESAESIAAPPPPPPLSSSGTPALPKGDPSGSGSRLPEPSGVPPPRPLAAGGMALRKAAPVQKKRKDVKALHWQTIPSHQIQNTIFTTVQRDSAEKELAKRTKELEELFSNAASKPQPTHAVASNPTGMQETASAGVLEPKRVMIFEIALKKFEVEPEQIVRAVSMLDPEGEYLSEDNVSVLQTLKAAEDETARAMAYVGSDAQIAKLSKSEQFLIYMAREQRWTTKLKATQAIRSYRQYADRLYEMMDSVMKASAEVRNSDKFRTVLGIVLWFGNYLNQGTRRGKAKGFRLSALPKLAEVRSKEKGTTLLQYMVATTAKKEPELLTFPEEFVMVKGASRIKKEDISMELSEFEVYMKHLTSETKAIVKEHNLPEQLLDGPRPNAAPGEIQKILDRYFVAEKSLSELKGMYDEMVAEVKELALYLGEENRNPRSEEIFGTLSSFMESFIQCRTIVLEQKERAEKLAKKAQESKGPHLESGETPPNKGKEAAGNTQLTANGAACTGSSVDPLAEPAAEIGSENQRKTGVPVNGKSNIKSAAGAADEVADSVGKLTTEDFVVDYDLRFTAERLSSEQASPFLDMEGTDAQTTLEQNTVEQGNRENRTSVGCEQGEETMPSGSSETTGVQRLVAEETPDGSSREDPKEEVPESGPVRESGLDGKPAPQGSAGVADGEPADFSNPNSPQGDASSRNDPQQTPETTLHSVKIGQARPESPDIDSEIELAETDDDFFEEDDAEVWNRLKGDN